MKKTRKSGSKMANGKGGPTSKVNQEVVDVIPTPHCGSTIYLLLYRYSSKSITYSYN